MKATAVKKLPDRFVVLVSGNASGGTIVYDKFELPLSIDATAVGHAIRRGLDGYRALSESDEGLAATLAASPLFEDFDEWSVKYPGVAVLQSETGLKLRARGSGAAKRVESNVQASASDSELGAAVLEAISQV